MTDRRDTERPGDEEFWQRQELRHRSCLGQPCCTLSGISAELALLPGDFAVVVHGEPDCLNSFRHFGGPSVDRFYCTRLTERHVAAGLTLEPLADCLAQLAAPPRPDVVFVLGTCLVEMIGDRFDEAAKQVGRRFGLTVRPLRSSGLRLSSQTELLDWLFETLAGLPQRPPVDPAWQRRLRRLSVDLQGCGGRRSLAAARRLHRSLGALPAPAPPDRRRLLNLVGLPEDVDGRGSELPEILAALGIEANGLFPYRATLDDWRCIASAGAAAVVDPAMLPRLTARLRRAGQRVFEVPLPIGLEQTERFYRAIGEVFGVRSRLERLLRRRRASGAAELAACRERFHGTRMAMGVRLLNNFRADQLAYGGLGDAPALAEMGFDLTLLVQGPPETGARERFGERLAELGCRIPFHVFPDPWQLGDLLAAGDYDVAYLADHSRAEAARAGVPMIVSRSLRPLFAGIADNVRTIARLLEDHGVGGRRRAARTGRRR